VDCENPQLGKNTQLLELIKVFEVVPMQVNRF
jgi:hypothetical protein